MHRDSIRPVADRLEQYFDWYVRADPDATPEAAALVSRFVKLARSEARCAREAQRLLRESRGFALGSAWEEMRAALAVLAFA